MDDKPHIFDRVTEEDIRTTVTKFFDELGFKADEFKFEKEFAIQLGQYRYKVEGKQQAFQHDQARRMVDFLVTRNGRPLAIIETKAPQRTLNEDDARQVISFARLVPGVAPFAIVTNGTDTHIYDTVTSTLIGTPTESQWFKNGQQVSSMNRDAQFKASQALIKINEQQIQLIFQANNNHLKQQRQERLNQARLASTVALGALIFGTLLVFAGIICIWFFNLTTGVVTAIAGIVTDIVSGLAFRFYKEANDRFDSITRELSKLDRITLAMHFISYISEREKKDQA